jgi:hypothetical protein
MKRNELSQTMLAMILATSPRRRSPGGGRRGHPRESALDGRALSRPEHTASIIAPRKARSYGAGAKSTRNVVKGCRNPLPSARPA